MRNAVVYDPEDIKKLLAEKHGVDLKDIIKSQCSYTVIIESAKEPEEPTE